MKRGINYREAVNEQIREGKSNSESRKYKKSNSKSGESSSVDLAPMVDIAFLLLTFFIMTTSFSKPKVFGMGLPQESNGGGGGGKKSTLVTMKISRTGTVYITKGEDKPDSPMDKVEFSKIRSEIKTVKNQSENITLIVKSHRKTDFGKVIDVLDEVYNGGVTEWATLTLNEADEKKIKEKEKK